MKKLLIPFKISLLTILFCVCLTNAGQRGLGTSAATGLVMQQIILKGKVLSAVNNEPLEGATIRTEITSIKTDQNGNFTVITKKDKGTFTVTYLGYQTKEIQYDISSSQYYAVKLDPQQNTLDETVVIAYGQTTKRFNTGSVGRVTAAEISRQPVANPIAALQGRIPGVEITQQSGRTGANFNVLIRGRSSIANGNEPLYLIDGVPWLSAGISKAGSVGSQSPFNSINPSDIESIEVLKDADATAIFGSRGANGVILITTKKGKRGKTEVGLNAYTGISRVGHTMPLMNTQEYIEIRSQAFVNDNIAPTSVNAPDLALYDQQRYTNWKKILIGNTAHLSDLQLNLSGGSDKTQFRISGAYRTEENVYPGDEADKRASAQLNLDHRSENEKFRISFTSSFSDYKNNILPTDLTEGTYTAPNLLPYEDNGSLSWSENGSAVYNNPLAATLRSYRTKTQNLVSNLNANYSITKHIAIRLNAGYTTIATDEANVYPLSSFIPNNSRISGESTFANSDFNSWIVEPQLTYNRSFGNHKLEMLLGSSWQEEKSSGRIIFAGNYSSEELLFSTTGASTLNVTEEYGLYRYQAIFGRINYQYKERYLFNLTGRRDGSSRFGPGRQFANFGAIGAAWIFTNENIIKNNLAFLSFGKFRAGYGLTGNDKIGDYQFLDTYGNVRYPYAGIGGLAPQRLYNPDYEWESNRKLEMALELGLLKDRILFLGAWFRNRSSNQLLQYTLPSQTGFRGITQNLPAEVENKGWEFEISTINLQKPAFKWNSSFNITRATNRLLDFPGLDKSSYANQYAIGESLNIVKLYPYLGVDPETGLWSVDLNNGRSVIRDLTPKFYGGLNNSFQFKGLQLDVFLQFVKKDGYSFIHSLPALMGTTNFNQPKALTNYWAPSNIDSEIQKPSTGGQAATARSNYLLSNGVITDASFIRLKNVSLSYRLPDRWLSSMDIKQLRIYFQGQNLLTFTGYEGNDPEVTSMRTLPPLRTLTFGIQGTF
ncbi:SusC/RagA family TonB-linked outer membrane protein [Olivibacter sp. CPCC 100613]|uniref:SusC/RagA family TonB-linked outer membrane protein n=1 Tax=Olivibacter sp. CPCC 100613 TaxID=3079931 RepID=UPI002FF77286